MPTAKWDTLETESLFRAVLALKNLGEAKRFFRDLLTENEIIEFANRWKAARMLEDRVPYPLIEKATGLSSTTVARVSKWLKNGMGGYMLVLDRIHHRRPKLPLGRRLR